jgi:hypothetical protein
MESFTTRCGNRQKFIRICANQRKNNDIKNIRIAG